jgi:hypothetical protein
VEELPKEIREPLEQADGADPTGLGIAFGDQRYFRLRRGMSFVTLIQRAKEAADAEGCWRDKLVDEGVLVRW